MGIAFAVTGLALVLVSVILAVNSLTSIFALIVAGLAFLLLALGFRHLKIKSVGVEIEANQ